MKHRKFLHAVSVALLGPLTVEAQQQPRGRVYRVGLLISGTVSSHKTRIEAFRQGLRELGYVETHNIASLLSRRKASGRRP
jgi:hypothetical protein